jgi:hypothetical protein
LQLGYNWVTTRVDNKWYTIVKHFQVFLHFNTKLNIFYVIKSTKQRATNVLWTSKAKEQNIECKKRKSNILSQIWSLDPLYFQDLYLAHFSFERFQRQQIRYLKIYKTYLKWKVKKTIVEKLKLQNHIEHLWKNPKHNPLHFERALYCSVFYKFGYIRWRTTKKI